MKLFAIVLLFVACASAANSGIRILPTQNSLRISPSSVENAVLKNFNPEQFREIRAQVIANSSKRPDHILVYLFRKGFHGVTLATIPVNESMVPGTAKLQSITDEDIHQQPGQRTPQCPNSKVEFISFAPNDDTYEVGIARDVATEAKAHGLVTVELYISDATREAWMNYMACPNLKGNFYDGDSNPAMIATNDGMIAASEIRSQLKNSFRHKVTNIWLACQAFNDPMLSAVMTDAQSQKYAAGISDLVVGPSDETAKCTMIEGLNGKPLSSSFKACFDQHDSSEDEWGFSGTGSDYFGQ